MAVRLASDPATYGTAVAARRCLHALRSVGVEVVWQPLTDLPGGCAPAPPDAAVPDELVPLLAPSRAGETLVLNGEPRGWRGCREALESSPVIGSIVWETERVPDAWRTQLQAADELWVPTEWNRRAFAGAFDGPIHVIPHAATTARPEPPPVALRDGTFVVADVAAWDWRKRPDRTIEAFLRAFGPSDDVALVLKTGRWPLAWPRRHDLPTVAHVADLVPSHRRAQVHVATGEWTEGQLLGLLDRADCYLSLTASEGWGLGAFDAACRGTPVVITGFGGQRDWLGEDHPGLLPYRRVPAEHPYTHLFDPGMEWGEADLDAAVDQLRDLRDGRAGALQSATRELRDVLPSRYAPERVGRIAADALPASARR